MTDKTGRELKKERRDAPRADVGLVIEYSDLEHFCEDYARNLSLGGLFVETRTPLELGVSIDLSFALPGYEGKIRSLGRVVRVRSEVDAQEKGERPGMAIKFEGLSEESKAIIDALVRKSLDVF